MTTPAGIDGDQSRRSDEFRRDLAVANGELVDLIRKHITTGSPAAIPDDTYFHLRRSVGRRFDVHPNSVVLVGSCRLGFSLKKKGKEMRRYLPTQSDSDVDVAVVSAKLFDSYWDRIFDLVGPRGDWALAKGKMFVRDLFCGWITPSNLPNLPRFDDAAAWTTFFDGLSRDRICGMRRITARLYRDWGRLEAYQMQMVTECHSELAREKTPI